MGLGLKFLQASTERGWLGGRVAGRGGGEKQEENLLEVNGNNPLTWYRSPDIPQPVSLKISPDIFPSKKASPETVSPPTVQSILLYGKGCMA